MVPWFFFFTAFGSNLSTFITSFFQKVNVQSVPILLYEQEYAAWAEDDIQVLFVFSSFSTS